MNSIVRKVLLVLALVFGLYTATVYSFMKLVVLPSFSQLQDSAVDQEVQRCRLILNKEMATISALCADWSAWDDACQFMTDRNEAFIKSALDPAVFQNTRLNAAAFIDPSGRIVWSRTFDYTTGHEIDIPQLHEDTIRETPFFYIHKTVDSERTGLMRFGDKLAMVSSRPIISSRNQLPIRGAILMVRFVSDDHIRALAESLGTEFTVRPAESVTARPEPGCDYAVERSGSDCVTAIAMLADVFGDPTLAIVATVPTPIITQGIWVNRFVSASVMLAGLATLFITFVLLKSMILRRLDDLGSVLNRVIPATEGSGDNMTADDELGRHTSLVMQMLQRLDSTQAALGASDERFRMAFFSAPFPIAIHDETGKAIQVNSRWTDATGYTMDEIGTSWEWCRRAYGPYAEAAIARLRTLYASQKTETSDVMVRCKDGRSMMWTISSSAIGLSPDGKRQFITLAVDVTDRHKALRRLSENESLFRSLTESMPAVTYLAEVTRDARLVYVSPQTMTFFGFRPDDMKAMPKPWKMVIDSVYYEQVMDERFSGVSATNQQYAGQYPALGRNGETMWLREEAVIVNTEKGPLIQGVLFDVTESMHHQDRSTNTRKGR
jgi:PAS domain S-box-containing protein